MLQGPWLHGCESWSSLGKTLIWSTPCRAKGKMRGGGLQVLNIGQYPFIDGTSVSGIFRSQTGTFSKEITPKLQIGGQRRGWVKGGAERTVLCRKHSLHGISSVWFRGPRARSERSGPGLCIPQHCLYGVLSCCYSIIWIFVTCTLTSPLFFFYFYFF